MIKIPLSFRVQEITMFATSCGCFGEKEIPLDPCFRLQGERATPKGMVSWWRLWWSPNNSVFIKIEIQWKLFASHNLYLFVFCLDSISQLLFLQIYKTDEHFQRKECPQGKAPKYTVRRKTRTKRAQRFTKTSYMTWRDNWLPMG